MSGIDLEITLQDQKLIAGLLRAAGKQKEWTSEVDKTKRESQKATAEVDRFVAAIKKIDAKPAETYRQQMDLLTKALKAGKVSQEEYERTSKRLLQTQQAADPFYQQQIKTEKERKRAIEETATALARKQAAEQRLSADRAASSKNFAMEVAGSLGLITNIAMGASMAVDKITEALRFTREEARAAAQDMDTLFKPRRTLNQVATSDADLRGMFGDIDRASSRTGLPREKATELRADARGAGLDAEFQDMAAAEAGAIDALTAGKMAKKVKGIYGKRDAGLNFRNITDMTMAASIPSDLSFEDLARGIAQASEGGVQVGASAEEQVGALSVLGSKFSSVDTAADRMKGFQARAGTNDRLKGKGLMGAFRSLRDDFTVEERKNFLGDSQELNVMYQYLGDFEKEIDSAIGLTKRARGESDAGKGAVAGILARAQRAPELAAPIEKQKAVQAHAVTREQVLGPYAAAQEAGLLAAQERQLRLNPNNRLQRGLGFLASEGAAFAGAPGAAMPAVSSGGGAFAEKMLSMMSPLTQAATLLKDAARLFKESSNQNKHKAANAELNQPIN